MADINTLNKEVNALRKQLKKQSADADKARRNMLEQNRRNLEAYEQQMHRAIAEHDAFAKAEYERLMREYRDSIDRDATQLLNDMGGEYKKLAQDVISSRAELDKKTAELEAEIAAIKDGQRQKQQGSAAEAQAFLREAADALHRADLLPHQKFEPGRLKIYFNAVVDGQDLYRAGLFEAASAVAVSARTGAERLILSVDEKSADWDERLNYFALSLKYLTAALKQELADWEAHTQRAPSADKAEKKRRLSEINYWSRGEFAQITAAAKAMTDKIAELNQTGKAEYLKRQDSPGTDELTELAGQAEKLRARLNSLSPLYKARYDASCGRYDLANAIADFMTGQVNLNLNEAQTGYAHAGEKTLLERDFAEYIPVKYGEGEKQDTRERFTLTFENASGAQIYIYIVPRECGSSVTNSVEVGINFNGAENKGYADDILRQVREAAGGAPVTVTANEKLGMGNEKLKAGQRYEW